ncbi:MAG: glycosyltransferase family 4 protein [Promethearchaeota archaeon]
MKIIWAGNVFNPTGLATANREIVKALLKLGTEIQCTDIWHDGFEFNKGLKGLNNPINPNPKTTKVTTIFADYPQFWREGHGKLVGYFLHEGTRLIPGWNNLINRVEKLIVCSEATRNLFKWNDVVIPIEVVPYGTNPEIYKPGEDPTGTFVFLSVNSWTGKEGDRKGTDLLIKAFDEEFKDEDVRLVLKIGTFWEKGINYQQAIQNILGHINDKIIVNGKYVTEDELAEHYYKKANCFVAPTRGEAFGLTIINAMACGLPVIVTKDVNSGHMDFCKGKDSVLWVDAPEVIQGDRRFYAEGNMLAEPDLESLKKQMRFAYENKDLREKALIVSEDIRKNWTWTRTAEKLLEVLK